jgi:hypothetical protein
MASRTKAEPPACRVVTQYRSAGEMVYELESSGANLDVRVSSQSSAPGERNWHVSAQKGRTNDAVMIEESAPTKAEALKKVAEVWVERTPELGLPGFDWDAVTAALLAVRAI